VAVSSAIAGGNLTAYAQAPNTKQPNIVVIMGHDIGIWNIGAYSRGLMAGRTPNLDKMAAEGPAKKGLALKYIYSWGNGYK